MTENTPRHFLDLPDLDGTELRQLINIARARKEDRQGFSKGQPDGDSPLSGKVLAMIFEKPSTRTRVSFDVGMRQLGGQSLVLNAQDMQLGRGETIADTAEVLSRFVDGIMLRTSAHDNLLELADYADVPVINGLTDASHPCQILADILTYEEHKGPIKDAVVAWVGDGNNVAASWVHAAVILGFELRLACPKELAPPRDLMDWAQANGGGVFLGEDANAAVDNCDCVVADTWVSMGDKDADKRIEHLTPYQVNEALMARTKKDAIFMHCLPAHRGEEVTKAVLEGPQSVVFDEAENRLHAQKAILTWCLNG